MSFEPDPATPMASDGQAALPGAEPVTGPPSEAVTGQPVALPPAVAPARRSTALLVAITVVAVLAGAALFASGWTLGRHAALTPGTPSGEAEAWQPFWDTYHAITERWAGADDVDHKALVEGAIKGMIAALDDPYSAYLTSEEFRATLQDISGEFEGVGATIGTVDANGDTASCTTLAPDCRLVVVAPITGSPADKAGLRPGDVITHIDGTALEGLTVDEARGRIRGPKDTAVRLTIERDAGAPFDVEIVRAVIVSPEVEAEDLAGGTVAYIKLSGFSDHAKDEFDRVVTEKVAAGQKQLIVDLRGNPGGFVTAARDIASQFLADGTIFWEQDAQGNQTETLAEAGGAATDPAIRLVVLVDGGSASASEIVAGALQDRGRATIVGSTTYGKGTVQQWTQLEGDHGGFRLTIARWLTPNKTWVHGKGIEPDVVVAAEPEQPGDDPALDAALEVLSEAATGLRQRPAA
jgi:carboxyl-terminal processing protease